VLQMIPLEKAQQIILQEAGVLPAEEIGLLQSLNRVLAHDIYAGDNLPPFDRSPLDGYAVRAEDIAPASLENPVCLEVIEEIRAGYEAVREVTPGTAIAVMTGSPLPGGADVVVMFEETQRQGQAVSVCKSYPANSNISRAGEDVRKGEMVLEAGSVITPGAVGMLAALGYSRVEVFRRPRVALLSTGDELVDIDQPLRPGKIRNSNLYALAAAVQEAGGETVLLGVAPDEREATAHKVSQGLAEADLVLTTGGVSVGDYDVVKEVLAGLGADLLFWRVAMKPGTPSVAAKKGDKLVIGLSGNPAAALITFELLVRPALRKMQGRKGIWRQGATAVMEDQFLKNGRQRRFLRAMVYREKGGYRVALAGKQNPGVMKSILHCNALIDVPPERGPLQAGDTVEVILL